MSGKDQETNLQLPPLMERALDGDKDAARLFLTEFLKGPIFVPERYQAADPAGAPAYPSDLVWVMGLQDSDRVIVPAFTDPEMIDAWAGGALTYRSPSGKALLDAVPDGWWLWLNPGEDIEKEFSPWEINELRQGPGSFDAVLDEIFPGEIIEPLAVHPLKKEERPDLKNALIEFAQTAPEIRRVFILSEEGKDFEGTVKTRLLVGIEADVKNSDEAEALRESVFNHASPMQIGSDPIKVLVGQDADDGLYLSLFKGTEPIYSRPSSSGLIRAAKKIKSLLTKQG